MVLLGEGFVVELFLPVFCGKRQKVYAWMKKVFLLLYFQEDRKTGYGVGVCNHHSVTGGISAGFLLFLLRVRKKCYGKEEVAIKKPRDLYTDLL